jgi:hypothetical protein
VRLRSTRACAGLAGVILAAGLISGGVFERFNLPAVNAQNIGQRVVLGIVTDPGGKLVSGATVFLKDLKSKSIRSYSTEASGKFRFTQVNMAEDHELWAEKDGRKTAVKTVSEWDSRKEFETELRMK